MSRTRVKYKKFAILMSSLFVSAACLTAHTAAAQSAEQELTFGIVPQQSASRLAKMWVPLMRELSAKSGLNLRFSTTKDIPTFEACLADGTYDIAYMNPYHYTVFHEASGYQAFARQKDKRLKGLIVVRQDAQVTGLNGLDGQNVAFPSPAAFGASVIPRAEMKARGLKIAPRYVKSHDSVYRAVSAGLMPAGGGVLRTFRTLPTHVKAKLKIIHQTDGYTPHAFAAHPDLEMSAIAQVFAAMHDVAQAKPELLNTLGMSGFEPGHDSDWDDVRSLDIDSGHSKINTAQAAACPSD